MLGTPSPFDSLAALGRSGQAPRLPFRSSEPFGDTQDKPLSMPIPQKPKEVPEDVLKKVLE